MRTGLLTILLALPAICTDQYLFTSFRGNGETGVYFALSTDGYQWTPVKENKPMLPPGHQGMLMRDPFLARGPDGVWHMIWTTNWDGRTLGHASSRDLVNWSTQNIVEAMANERTALNVWAPEAAWDEKQKHWVVFWASTVPARVPSMGENEKRNHRMYAATTKDLHTFTGARVWFDPGFNTIDSTLVRDGNRWIMVFKDEREKPLQKRLRLAFADSPGGPWSGVTEPFSRDWVEGPSVVRIGQDWMIYFDSYRRPQHYGAYRTRNWKDFEEVTPRLSFPQGHRHGTVVRITEADAKRLAGLR